MNSTQFSLSYLLLWTTLLPASLFAAEFPAETTTPPVQAAGLLSDEEIGEYNKTSPVKIVHTFDPAMINTLVVGSKMIESMTHFFGGQCHMGTRGGFGSELVDTAGNILQDRDIRLGLPAQLKIPDIRFDGDDNLVFYFPGFHARHETQENISSQVRHSWTDALAHQGRSPWSPYETDPTHTIYLDLSNGDGLNINCKSDLIHLQGSIFELQHLPKNMKVKKILIEYLGDCVYGSNSGQRLLESKDWTWLANLQNILADDGEIYFEMRNDVVTRQFVERPSEMPNLSQNLMSIAETIKREYLSIGWIVNVDVIQQLFDLEDNEAKLVLGHLTPKRQIVGNKEGINTVLMQKFESQGYSAQTKLRKFIPNRFYPTIFIHATKKNRVNQ